MWQGAPALRQRRIVAESTLRNLAASGPVEYGSVVSPIGFLFFVGMP
jgi:hypothetical protein